MGDDLKAARQFVELCSVHMNMMLSADSKREPLREISDNVSVIHEAACQVKARAIIRAAEMVRADILKGVPSFHLYGSMLSLSQLVKFYENGLIESEVKVTNKTEADSSVFLASQVQELNQAQKHLLSLIKFAPNNKDRSALNSLASLSFESLIDDGRARKLEDTMPDLTSYVIDSASRAGKSVSLSYAFADVEFDADSLEVLSHHLMSVISDIIDQSIDTPVRRRSGDLPGGAHIAITSEIIEDGLDILISTEGKRLSGGEAIETASNWLLRHNGVCETRFDEGLVRVKFENIPLKVAQYREFVPGLMVKKDNAIGGIA